MPRQIIFTVPGAPQGKGRAKTAARIVTNKATGRAQVITRHYTPEKTVSYENLVRLAGEQAMRGRPPFAGPVRLDLDIVCPVPASWSGVRQRRALAGEIVPTTKPDKDNVEKAVCDGLNGIAFSDDCRITEGSQRKRYGLTPGVTVVVTELDTEPAQGRRA